MNPLAPADVAHRASANENLRAHCQVLAFGTDDSEGATAAHCLPYEITNGKKEEAMNSQQGNRGSNQSGMQDDKTRQAGQGSGTDNKQRGSQQAGSGSGSQSDLGKQSGNQQQSGSKIGSQQDGGNRSGSNAPGRSGGSAGE